MTTKHPSGAAGRKRRRLAAKAEAEHRAALGPGQRVGPSRFAALGALPQHELGTVLYGLKAAGLLLADVLADSAITEPDRRRMAKDIIRVIALTGPRALFEERLMLIEQQAFGEDTRSVRAEGGGR